jgi:phage terminase large subunit-like protein
VRQTSEADGYETEIVIEQEPGSSGKSLADHFIRNILPDFLVRVVPATKGKMVRAQPFLAAAEHGHTRLLAGLFRVADGCGTNS